MDAPTHGQSDFQELVASLCTPVPDDVPAPATLPPGIDTVDDGYVLASTGMAMRWVAPVAHWLGAALPRMPVANPIRSVSGTGFFIARDALPGTMDYAAALALCAQLTAGAGAAIRLPTADEWEMAARGPDGRRFPWGNNARSDAALGLSPWGIAGAVGQASQWTAPTAAGGMVVCGGKRQTAMALCPARRGRPGRPVRGAFCGGS
jgi:hypothetical protein